MIFFIKMKCGDEVDAKKLTEAAMLSSLFIAAGIFFIGTGIAYSIFLDIGVPILITLIYLRCETRYTILASVTSLILVTFVFGNLAVSISMIQGMLIGFVCGFLINRNTLLNDDFLYCSLLAAIVLIFIDLLFSGILGYSFVKEANEYLVYFPYDDNVKEVVFYILIATMPLGTIIMTYIGAVFFGKKLRLLNKNGERKYLFLRNYKKYGNFQYCSRKTTYIGLVYIILIKLIGRNNILFRYTYIKLILMTFAYILIYFLVKDAYSILCGTVHKIFKSRGALIFTQILILYSLLYYFQIAFIVVVTASIIVDTRFSIRKNTNKFVINMF